MTSKENAPWKLIVGLGNDDPDYDRTYHNAGFFGIDFIQNALRTRSSETKLHWLKPALLMNRSGGPVAREMKRYHISPQEILVIHDDSDLPLGSYKLSFGRGSAGHKGIQDIIDTLKTKDFWRLRIGIRPVLEKTGTVSRRKAASFVLKKMAKTHIAEIEKALRDAFQNEVLHRVSKE